MSFRKFFPGGSSIEFSSLLEFVLHLAGGIFAAVTLGFLLAGIWRGTRRKTGRTSGTFSSWLRSAFFYFITTLVFLVISVAGWQPLPFHYDTTGNMLLLIIGSLFTFPGLGLVLWSRLALGKMYFTSSAFGAQLYADHTLVTSGPYALVRHPLYLGLIAAAFGSLLLYHTFTTLAFAIMAPFVLLRAGREEKALAAEFGDQWLKYCRRVPAFFPRWKRK